MMNYLFGRLPLMLEVLVNGFYLLIKTLKKSNQLHGLLEQIPIDEVLEHSTWFVPTVIFLTLIANFLKSSGFEDFVRKHIFSVIVFIPLLMTWGDQEFIYWLSAVHLFSTLLSFYEKNKDESIDKEDDTGSSFLFRLKLAPAQVVLLSFGGLILSGTLILLLPVSAATGNHIKFIDAFFMATSATCVTGLSTISLADEFSTFGQMVMLLLSQIGGLGIMTLSSSFALIMGKNLQMREQIIMQDLLDTSGSDEVLKLIVDIIRYTFVIEFLGAIFLTVGFYQEGLEIGQALYFGFYHSIMAFCNAGYTLFNSNLENFKFTPLIHFTILVLFLLGGLGFAVMKDLFETIKSKRALKTLSIHTKLVLSINAILIILTTVYLFFGEFLHAFQNMTAWERFQVSLFQAVTPRTAGFNTVNIGSLHPHSVYLMALLMFIGASPGSTGGGVKTTTFAILLQSVTATLKGKPYVEFFERRVPASTVVKSIAIFIISLMIVSAGILIMMRIEPDKSFLSIFFEVTSAFCTVGLSLGITPFLTAMGKIVLIVMMFFGRVGPLTLVLAVGSRVVMPGKVEYPEGKILIG